MLKFIRFASYFISINFLTENMGFFTHWLNLGLGMTLLVCFSLTYFPFNLTIGNKGLWMSGIIFFLLGFTLLPQDIILRITGVLFILFGLDLFLRGVNNSAEELPVLLFATTCYLFFMVFYKFNPFVWCWEQGLSLALTTFISSIGAVNILSGHTFLGLHATILLIFLILSSYLFSQKKKASVIVSTLVLVIVVQIIYIIGIGLLGRFLHKTDILLLTLPLYLPLLQLIPLYINLRRLTSLRLTSLRLASLKVEFQPISLNLGKDRVIPAILILILVGISIGFLTLTPSASPAGKEKVVFYTRGFVNWLIPNFEDFGSRSGGMFGNLPLFVARLGFEPAWTETINQETLKETKILVMINIDEPIPETEKEAIWDFVKKGGALLLLGDHTFYKKGGSNHLNDLLKPVHIKYNFDSADYFIGGWLHSYEYLVHPITIGLKDVEDEPGIVVGASLKVDYPAYPIIMGKYGYSDPGREDNPDEAYLGNLDYDPGEQLGDLILVACQNYGQGKVLVFGDTSSLANPILVFSHDFANQVFTWLAGDKRDNFNHNNLFVSLLGLIIALVLFLIFIRNPVILICLAGITLSIIYLATDLNLRNHSRIPKGNIAYVDNSHLGHYSLEFWKPDGVMGLHFNLMRNGYLSFMLRDFSKEKLLNSDILILIAPTKPFTNKEIEIIKEYLNQGGVVILSVGYEEKGGSLKLMEDFGFGLLNVPLGYFQVEMEGLNQTGTFYKGWPVTCDNEKAEVLCSAYNYPLIVSLPYGKGKFVIIGDTFFFSNQILEEEERPHLEAIYFFRWLLHTLLG
ncbi:MAG: hypothetical protein QME42_07740 [bacterium]|nr:hypothetical protein [bacterium]